MSARPIAIDAAVMDHDDRRLKFLAELIGRLHIRAHVLVLRLAASDRAIERVDDDSSAMIGADRGADVGDEHVNISDQIESGGEQVKGWVSAFAELASAKCLGP